MNNLLHVPSAYKRRLKPHFPRCIVNIIAEYTGESEYDKMKRKVITRIKNTIELYELRTSDPLWQYILRNRRVNPDFPLAQKPLYAPYYHWLLYKMVLVDDDILKNHLCPRQKPEWINYIIHPWNKK